ncbi:hypothetical protein BVC80_8301g6 [Macleaya cordata]|uniref:Uncharacterized protein n=1 Tax=Macleaya cordata TaxID=56857 RepID=A0A200QRR7_MACCD|nr:hypothetical protein BVC80_8301g6 [Macleaya cordata]
MDHPNSDENKTEGSVDGFSTINPTRVFWNSRKRSANGRIVNKPPTDDTLETPDRQREESPMDMENPQESSTAPALSERRKALFEPLEPTKDIIGARRSSAEMLLPPPDFDSANYPKGWLIGKKRKLVNVDVVESMRRIAVQEMNRKDREIDGLNEQLEEDARALEHLQVQLLEERSKRTKIESENKMLQSQISMLMNMLQEPEEGAEEEEVREDS